MSFNRAGIENQLMLFLFLYVIRGFEAGKFLQGTACEFFKGHFLTRSRVPLSLKKSRRRSMLLWKIDLSIFSSKECRKKAEIL